MTAETWRERDLRGKHGATPRSVSSVVLRVAAALELARAGESFLFLVAGFAVTQAAVVQSNGNTADKESLGLALLMGCLAAASWWRTQRSDARSIARELDRRLRHGGGLLTAFELEDGGLPVTGGGAVGALLISRVLRRLRLSEALRAMFPPLVVPIAAPLIGLGLLALALEEEGGKNAAAEGWEELATGMLGAFDALEEVVLEADASGALRSDDLGGLLRAVDVGRSVERRREFIAADPGTREAGEAELAQLGQDLARLAARARGEQPLEDRIEEARNWVEAVRMELETAVTGSARKQPGSEQRTSARGGSEEGVPGVRGEAPVTALSKNGTMGGSTAETGPADDTRSNQDATTATRRGADEEAGTLAGDYWPPAYDGVISGWIEYTRKRKETRTR